MSTDIFVWIQALFIFMVLSIVWKVDNPLFKFVQSTVIGVSAGIIALVGQQSFNSVAWSPLITNNRYELLIPIILGFLLFARFYMPISWLTRYPVSVLAAVGLGLALRSLIEAQVVDQIVATVNTSFLTPNMYDNVVNFILFLTVLSSTVYFFFTIEHKGVVGYLARIGRILMFGAFGYFAALSTLRRQTNLIMQVQFLLWDWLGLK